MNAFGLSDDATQDILRAGVLAPSADNHHLFRFSLQDNQIRLLPSDEYLAANTQRKLLAWISFGAVVENICIQASQHGVRADLAWFPSEDIVCEIRGQPAGLPTDSLQQAIPLRHTNRNFFFGDSLSSNERLTLTNQIAAIDGIRLVWLDAAAVRRVAIRLVHLAERERFRRRPLHDEMFSSVRFDVGPRGTCDTGIPIGATEIDLLARPMFRLMRHWPIMRALNSIGADWFAALRAAYLPARSAPHLVLLVATGDLQGGAIQAGRAMERLWLQATLLHWDVQPVAAGALYALPQFEAVSPPIRHALHEGWRKLAGDGTPLMLLRIGHGRPASVRAGRPDLGKFLASRHG